jgi:hypothetical protein
MIGSHHTILYDEAGVHERNWWSILITSHTAAVYEALAGIGLSVKLHDGLLGYSQ